MKPSALSWISSCLTAAFALAASAGGADDPKPQTSDDDPITAAIGHDSVVLEDGRILRGTVIAEGDEKFLHLPHGRVRLPSELVVDIVLEPGDDYIPKDAKEEKWLEQGRVFFQGGWMRRERREQILEERRLERDRHLQELAERIDFANAWEKTTPHLQVRSNTSPELLERYAGLLESFYDHFADRWRLRLTGSDRRLRPEVRIYRDRAQYLAAGAPRSSSGFFHQVDRVLSLYHDSSDPENTLDVLFHEGTHLLLSLRRPNFLFPVWLDEGLAEYYGSMRPDEQGSLSVGAIQEGRLVVLRHAFSEGRSIPLAELLMTSRDRFGNMHYAEAWSLVHFLQHHRRHAVEFKGFFHQIAAGRELREFSIEVAGSSRRTVSLEETRDLLVRRLKVRDLDELEAQWRRYVEEELAQPGPRGWVVAGKLHLRDRQVDLARNALEKAIEMGSRDPTAWLTLARVHRLREDWESCAVAFRRCTELSPLDPEAHHEFGRTLRKARTASEELRAEALDRLYLAIELHPTEPRYRRALTSLR